MSNNPTIASLDCPTYIRRKWSGPRFTREAIDLLSVYFSRWYAGDLLWR